MPMSHWRFRPETKTKGEKKAERQQGKGKEDRVPPSARRQGQKVEQGWTTVGRKQRGKATR